MKQNEPDQNSCANGEVIEESVQIVGGDFTAAGKASLKLKEDLMGLQIDEDIISRAGTAAFEAEMNVIIHAAAGWMRYCITPGRLKLVIEDMGPGIDDIVQAMKDGYSTAPDWVREMGWGAGMGLPNIKRNSDEFKIDSVVNEGTSLEIIINLIEEKKNEPG